MAGKLSYDLCAKLYGVVYGAGAEVAFPSGDEVSGESLMALGSLNTFISSALKDLWDRYHGDETAIAEEFLPDRQEALRLAQDFLTKMEADRNPGYIWPVTLKGIREVIELIEQEASTEVAPAS